MNKLAIVGSGQETRNNAPFGDKSFDVWVFNEAAKADWCKRFDASFQMHEPEIYFGHNTKDAGYADWLKAKHGKPVYMQEVDPLVPDSVRYPLEQAQALCGLDRYMGATVCDAIALALIQGYQRIEIWGVEMSYSEYQYQSACYRFWIGVARGRLGAENVVLHSGKKLFEMPLYGYEGNFVFGEAYFATRANRMGHEWDSIEKHLMNVKKLIEKRIQKREFGALMEAVTEYQEASIKGGELAGAISEADRYRDFAGRFADRGGFEFAAATAQNEGESLKEEMCKTAGKVEYVWNVWRQTNNPAAGQQLLTYIEKLGKQSYDMGARHGIYTENIGYILKYDDVAQANGAPIAPAPITMPTMAAV
jgi:hypothetical protein